ncbi:MAG TPA: acyl-CoA thioesterase [Bacteroidia bacterium]|nr:acyl-CoA thioesterase [Bacteroidia bacterium]
MKVYKKNLELRWSDLDPNYHLRHSVYYDLAAQIRTSFLEEHGLTIRQLQELHLGPVLFREEGIFRREIRFGEQSSINLQLLRLKKDYSRFSFRHEITREDGTHCAIITVDGAWIDTLTRKLTSPPELGISMINDLPKAEGFEWTD